MESCRDGVMLGPMSVERLGFENRLAQTGRLLERIASKCYMLKVR